MNGILLVDKPLGVTSHAVVARLRRDLAVRKVGHAGTLDPAASGLLIVGVGAGTRLLTYLVGLDKTYEATIRLGLATDTDDAAGAVTASAGCEGDIEVEAALDRFRGPILQRPSAVSAIKVAGRRAYARVRAGEQVELAQRPVVVHSLDLLAVRPGTASTGGSHDPVAILDVDVRMSVSSGTYVRAIARDLGEDLGVGGHLSALRRTRVGPFPIEASLPPDRTGAARLLAMGEVAAQVLPMATVPPESEAAISHGSRLPCADVGPGPVALLTTGGDLLAVANCAEGRWKHQFVVPSETLERS